MTEQNKQPIAKIILEKVKKGEVKMKSKYYFTVCASLVIFGAVIIFALLIYFTSFIIYALQRSGLVFLPGFGLHGFRLLVGNFPWLLVVIILVFILLLEIFAKRYSLVYRRPLLYSALAVIALVALAGLAVRGTSFHDRLYEQVEAGHFSLVKPLYKGPGMHFDDDFHPGQVLEITPDGFIMQRRDGEILLVSTSTNTKFPFFDVLEIGDEVMVIGDEDNGQIFAVGVREIPDNLNHPISPGRGRMMR